MAPEESSSCLRLPIGIYWDITSCPIPDGVDHASLLNNLLGSLRLHVSAKYSPKFLFIYGDFPASLPDHDGLEISKVPVSAGDDGLRWLMFRDMMHLAIDYPFPQAAGIAIISQSSGLMDDLYRFGLYGHKAVLICPSTAYFCPITFNGIVASRLDWLSVAFGRVGSCQLTRLGRRQVDDNAGKNSTKMTRERGNPYPPVQIKMACLWELDGGKPSETIVENVYNSLTSHGGACRPFLVDFLVYPDKKPDEDSLTELEADGYVAFFTCPRSRKPFLMLFRVLLFMVKYPPPATFFFITGIPDFTPFLLQLKNKGYTVMAVASNDVALSAFQDAGIVLYDSHPLLRGEGTFPLGDGSKKRNYDAFLA